MKTNPRINQLLQDFEFVNPELAKITGSGWLDILVGLSLAVLFLRSALFVLRGAFTEIRRQNKGVSA